MRFFLTVLLIATSGLSIGTGDAQEVPSLPKHRCRVWIAPSSKAAKWDTWYPPAIHVVEGHLIQFDHRGLRIEPLGGKPESAFAATRVMWVELLDPNESSQQLLESYVEGRYGESLKALPPALKARPPVWRQQQLTMIASCAGCWSGQEKISLNLISQLDRRPLPPVVLGWAPIAWKGYPFDPSRRRVPAASWVTAAKESLDDKSPLARLVAASWLLSSPERPVAIKQIKELITKKDRPSVAALAYCLLWSTATPPQVKSNQTKWMRQLEQLPLPLQMGPMMVLERKLQATGESELAGFLEQSINLTPIAPHPLLANPNLDDRSR